ncbi:hypothetical protein FM107_17630 [Sphingobacterium sp. JB170]|nr:hypothetical protein FM107_17630 [Sphingobacterium sp. JB170]
MKMDLKKQPLIDLEILDNPIGIVTNVYRALSGVFLPI